MPSEPSEMLRGLLGAFESRSLKEKIWHRQENREHSRSQGKLKSIKAARLENKKLKRATSSNPPKPLGLRKTDKT